MEHIKHKKRIVKQIHDDGLCPELTVEQLTKAAHPDPNILYFTAMYEVVLDYSTGRKCTKTISAYLNINTDKICYRVSL